MIEDNNPTQGSIEEDAIQSYVDGASDEATRRRIMAAMAVDERLEARIEGYQRQNNNFTHLRRSLKMPQSPAQDELVAAIQKQLDKRQHVRTAGIRVAASIAILASIGSGWYVSLEPDKRASIRQSLTPPLAKTVSQEPRYNLGSDIWLSNLPADAFEDEISFGWWERHRIAELLRLPNLQSLGLRLVHGGVLNSTDAPAVRLLYVDDADQRINLIVGMSEYGRDDAFTVLPEGQMSLHWRDNDLVFALIGPATSTNFQKVVELVSQSVIEANAKETASIADTSGGEDVVAGAAAPTPPALLMPLPRPQQGPLISEPEDIPAAIIENAQEDPPEPL